VTVVADFASGKGHRDENFPVASRLVRPELRPPILAFYRFARAADDVADHEAAGAAEKLAQLDRMEAGLLGNAGTNPEGEALHAVLQARGLSDQHPLHLLEAFRRDVTKRRYADWNELMDYCRYSAAPVGRFVLDLHGEPPTIWAFNDPLCAALQVINHLQDCAKDYRNLDRVYIPWPRREQASKRSPTAWPRRSCARQSQALHDVPQRCSSSRDPSRTISQIGGWRWRWASSRRWQRASRFVLRGAIRCRSVSIIVPSRPSGSRSAAA
jgi:squalene synthase HpnC